MKAKEMIELVQQHHPHIGETEAIKLINRAKDEFCEETELIKDTYTSSSVADQRNYTIDNRIIKIISVSIDFINISWQYNNLK